MSRMGAAHVATAGFKCAQWSGNQRPVLPTGAACMCASGCHTRRGCRGACGKKWLSRGKVVVGSRAVLLRSCCNGRSRHAAAARRRHGARHRGPAARWSPEVGLVVQHHCSRMEEEDVEGRSRVHDQEAQQHLHAPRACAAGFIVQLGQSCLLDSSSMGARNLLACLCCAGNLKHPPASSRAARSTSSSTTSLRPSRSTGPGTYSVIWGAVARAGGAARHHAQHLG